jgi:hypothetical protein
MVLVAWTGRTHSQQDGFCILFNDDEVAAWDVEWSIYFNSQLDFILYILFNDDAVAAWDTISGENTLVRSQFAFHAY